ncbi:MAG: hypothetical protein Q4F25_01075 [Eubacteriales bacterium]|nr:hypothetical protein [Eubacteriales bacterium]
MKLINKEQINAFEKAVNECSNSVWLVSDSGKWYDMKSETEKKEGMAEMAEAFDMELFASNYEDELTMMKFYRTYMMAA